MTKWFCDGCGEVIKRCFVGDRLRRYYRFPLPDLPPKWYTQMHVEVMAGQEGGFNSGNLCLDCLLKIITEGVDE